MKSLVRHLEGNSTIYFDCDHTSEFHSTQEHGMTSSAETS